MATITLAAAAVDPFRDAWTLAAGASKVAAVALLDDDAATRIANAGVGGDQTFSVNPAAIPDGSAIVSVSVRLRHARNGGKNGEIRALAAELGGGLNEVVGAAIVTAVGWATNTTAIPNAPGGAAWTKANLALHGFGVRDGATGFGSDVSTVTVEVVYNPPITCNANPVAFVMDLADSDKDYPLLFFTVPVDPVVLAIGEAFPYPEGIVGPSISITGTASFDANPLILEIDPHGDSEFDLAESATGTGSITFSASVGAVAVVTGSLARPELEGIEIAIPAPSISTSLLVQISSVVTVGIAIPAPGPTTGERLVHPEPLVLELMGIPTGSFYPGPFPAGVYYPFTTGPQSLTLEPGVDGLALLIPAFEPLSVGEVPIPPDLVETVEVQARVRSSRSRAGLLAGRFPLSTKFRPRFRVRYTTLTPEERTTLREFFRDQVQGTRFAFDLAVDGPGTPLRKFRPLEDPETVLKASRVYDVAEFVVEEIF